MQKEKKNETKKLQAIVYIAFALNFALWSKHFSGELLSIMGPAKS